MGGLGREKERVRGVQLRSEAALCPGVKDLVLPGESADQRLQCPLLFARELQKCCLGWPVGL